MNFDRRVLLHVGFSKTASTSLQRNVFSRLETIYNVGKPYQNRDIQDVFRHVTFSSVLRYDPLRLRTYILDVLQRVEKKHKCILVSNEGFTYARHNDPSVISRRLEEIFGGAQVLFLIREQVSWAVSLYLDDLRRSPPGTSVGTLGQWFVSEERKHGANVFSMADFAPVIRYYAELFGRENTHVLPFDYLYSAPDRFSVELGTLLNVDSRTVVNNLAGGIQQNMRPSLGLYWVSLGRNLLVPYLIRSMAARVVPNQLTTFLVKLVSQGPRVNIRIPRFYAEKLQAQCREGNRWIAKEFNLDLSNLGYAL